ncbi:HlyD family secretion protein [Labrys neptuniae]|uniref:HlyD family efflux transporter periplasmic adaptor subunit n=1 Tax=Labrys neptuniae TaxID=376174 RepID=A0ABV3PWE6_9HYPH
MKFSRAAAAMSSILALSFTVIAGVLVTSNDGQADVDAQKSPLSPIVAAARGRVEVEGGLARVLAVRDGIVTRVFVGEGDPVKSGQLLAELDPRGAELALQAAEAVLKEADARQSSLRTRRDVQLRQLQRMRRAAREQAVSPQALDETEAAMAALIGELRGAEAAVALAAAKVANARYELDQRQVRATTSGRIARRLIKAGDVVSATAMTEMFVIIPETPVVVHAEIQENFVRRVKPGMVVDIVAENDDRTTTPGRVLRVSAFLDSRRSSDGATERVDVRVADSVIQIQAPDIFVIGQRVYVRFHEK